MTHPEYLDIDDLQEWYFGLFLNQQYLRDQSDSLRAELRQIKHSLSA